VQISLKPRARDQQRPPLGAATPFLRLDVRRITSF
jgi:hypothetical protein